MHPTMVELDDQTLVLTLPQITIDAGQYLIITIKEGTGILAPKAPQGFHDPSRQTQEQGYPVQITFVDTANGSREYPGRNDEVIDKNFVVVNNPVSTTEPGAAVRIDLATHASHKLEGNEEIVVDFSGPSSDTHFILPESIKSSHVRIRSANTFSPADVLVQGQRVILTIPTIPTIPEDNAVEAGDFIISFSQVAGIKNPLVAGHRIITVSSFLPHYEPDEVTAVIRRTTTIDPDEGPRGSEFTLEGKGYQKGTVTIFEDKNNDRTIDAGETLTSVKTEKGAFSAMLTARGEYGEPAYMVSTRDSNGETASVSFTILPSIELEPGTAILGFIFEDDYPRLASERLQGGGRRYYFRSRGDPAG